MSIYIHFSVCRFIVSIRFAALSSCSSSPCGNGICIDLSTDFVCICEDGNLGSACPEGEQCDILKHMPSH